MQTKKCTLCGQEYPATTLYFYKNGKYLRSRCKRCESKLKKAKREGNKDEGKMFE